MVSINSKFIKNILYSYIFQFIGLLSGILLVYYTTRFFSEDELNLFYYIRRLFSFLIPIFTLSIGIGLTKFISKATNNKRISLFINSSIIIMVFHFTVSICVSLLYLYFFSKGNQIDIFVYIISPYLLFVSLSNIIISYFRGLHKIVKANLVSIYFNSLSILVFVLILQSSIFEIFLTMTFVNLLLVLVILHIIFKDNIQFNKIKIKKYIKILYFYSLPRVLASFLLVLLISYPVFYLEYIDKFKFIAHFSIGISIIQIIANIFGAFSFVILPKMASLKSNEEKQKNISMIVNMSIKLSLFIVLHLSIYWYDIMELWVGTNYVNKYYNIYNIYLFTGIFYFYFVILRNVIDAIENRAINTYNIVFALFISFTFLILFNWNDINGILFSHVSAFFILGLLSNIYIIKKYNIKVVNKATIIILNIIFIFMSFYAKQFIISSILIVFCELSIFILYLFILFKLKEQWLLFILSKFQKKKYE